MNGKYNKQAKVRDRTITTVRTSQTHFVIGIDEVGRGSLAGPVTVAAAMMPRDLRLYGLPFRLRDSKKLSARQREILFDVFRAHPKIQYAIASVGHEIIDRINISQAANLAATRAVCKLAIRYQPLDKKVRIFLDGGLYLNRIPGLTNGYTLMAKTLIKADEKITAVKIASIIAKVHRDGKMRRLAKNYPQYGMEIHKGYGTKIHVAALKKYGPSEIHRRAFIRNITEV